MRTEAHIGTVRRIGLIGDVHAEDERLAQTLAFLSRREFGLDALLCTGDVADGGGCIERCVRLLAEHAVHTVAGNHDRWLLQNRVRHVEDAHHRAHLSPACLAWLRERPKTLEFTSPLGPGLLCHGIGEEDQAKVWPGSARLAPERSATLDALLAERRFGVLLNGHMHFRCVIHFEALTLVNAGTLKPRHRPGFSIVDFDAGTIDAYEFDRSRCRPVTQRTLAPRAEDRVWRDSAAFDGNWEPTLLYAGAPA